MECEEPNCRFPAVKEWKGKKLCQDCWEKYKENFDRMERELKSMD